jgi:hypothetical protein
MAFRLSKFSNGSRASRVYAGNTPEATAAQEFPGHRSANRVHFCLMAERVYVFLGPEAKSADYELNRWTMLFWIFAPNGTSPLGTRVVRPWKIAASRRERVNCILEGVTLCFCPLKLIGNPEFTRITPFALIIRWQSEYALTALRKSQAENSLSEEEALTRRTPFFRKQVCFRG